MVNFLAILVASIVGYIIPMIWYSKALFGKSWMRYSKIKEMRPTPIVMVSGFIATIIFNIVFAIVITFFGVSDFTSGMLVGFVLWIGFIATTMLNGVLYNKMPAALYLINTVQYLLSMMVVGGILSVWQ